MPIILVLGRLRQRDLLSSKLTWVIEQNPVIYKQIHAVPLPQVLKTRRQSCANKMYRDTPTCMGHPARGVYEGF